MTCRTPPPHHSPAAALLLAGLTGLALACAQPAAAAEMINGIGVNTVYVGVSRLSNHASLGDLQGLNTPPGLNLDVGSASTLGIGFVRDLAPKWSVELAIGVPPTVRTNAKGANWALLGIAPGSGVADVDVLSPTVFLNWHPQTTAARWDPFVGLGINYTRFANTKALAPLQNALGPTELSLSDSWGLAAHAGLIYHFDQHWSLVGAVAVADVDSTLTVTSYSPAALSPRLVTAQSSTHINFHPVVYTLAVGYSF